MTIALYISVILLTINFTLLTLAKKKKVTEEDLLPTEETVVFLFTLSETIKNCFINATGENYDILLKSLYEYYNNLDDIYCMLNDEKFEIKHNGTRLMAKIIGYGEPMHVKTKFDYRDLRFKFGWDDYNVQEIKEVVKSTKSLWENSEFLYNEKAFDEFALVTNFPDPKPKR